MLVTITSKKQPVDDKLGKLETGKTYDMPEHKAQFYIQRGEAMCYQTKVLQDRPLADAGKVEQSSAAPADRVYATKTLNESADGEQKKRGRKPKL